MGLGQTILKDSEALYTFLDNIIPHQPNGRAEYTTLPQSNFTESEYQRLFSLLETLKAKGVIGYRQWEQSVSVVIHKRKTDSA